MSGSHSTRPFRALLMAGHGRAATNGLSLSNGRMGGPEKLKRGAGWRRKRGLKGNADATRPFRALLMAGHGRAAANGLSLSNGDYSNWGYGTMAAEAEAGPSAGVSFPSIEPPPRLLGLVWVYILEHADHSYYVGQSWDVAERLHRHRTGDGGKHPADHREPRLVYCEGPFPPAAGFARERQLKRWSRAKKEALLCGDLVTLRALSQSRENAQTAPRGRP